MQHLTQLRYLPFYLGKPDLETALSAILFDCGTIIRKKMHIYESANFWLNVLVQYEPYIRRTKKTSPPNST